MVSCIGTNAELGFNAKHEPKASPHCVCGKALQGAHGDLEECTDTCYVYWEAKITVPVVVCYRDTYLDGREESIFEKLYKRDLDVVNGSLEGSFQKVTGEFYGKCWYKGRYRTSTWRGTRPLNSLEMASRMRTRIHFKYEDKANQMTYWLSEYKKGWWGDARWVRLTYHYWGWDAAEMLYAKSSVGELTKHTQWFTDRKCKQKFTMPPLLC